MEEWKRTTIRIEMLDDYYDKVRGVFDDLLILTGAQIIKIQHPEK